MVHTEPEPTTVVDLPTPPVPAPPSPTDAELLTAYVGQGSQSAFTELVRRHLPLVQAAARRQLRGGGPLVDDVVQAVFILLAKKARGLSKPHLLAPWLLKATHFACRDARKIADRRTYHERKAAEMTAALKGFVETPPHEQLEQGAAALVPVLDDVLADLRDADRTVVVLRFLEGKTVAEVGRAVGISEAAAAKRIERSLAKLRTLFARRGVALPLAALGAAIALAGRASATTVTSVAQATAVAHAALTAAHSAGAAGASATIAKGAGHLMTVAKVKAIAAAVSIATVTVAGTAVVVRHVHGTSTVASNVAATASPSRPKPAAPTTPPLKPPQSPPSPEPRIELAPKTPPATPKSIVPPPASRPSPPTLATRPSRPFFMARAGFITGVVRVEGAPPEPKPAPLATGARECEAHHPISDESVLVDRDGGVANVVLFVKQPADGPDLPGSDRPPHDPAVLDQQGCRFVPHVLAVQVGQAVVAKNSDPFLHTVHTRPEKNTPDNIAEPTVDPGKKLKVPTDAEIYGVKCDVHPWMNAYIAVVDNPFFAVTAADGSFTLPQGLPDGRYTLHAWHEKFGEQDVALVVEDHTATVELVYRVK